MGQFHETAPPGKSLTTFLQFTPLSVFINNYSGYYLFCPDSDIYVPPFQINVVVPLFHATYGQVLVQSPFATAQNPTIPGSGVEAVFSDAAAAYDPGMSLIGLDATNVPPLNVNIGTLQNNNELTIRGRPGFALSTQFDTPGQIGLIGGFTVRRINTTGTMLPGSKTLLFQLVQFSGAQVAWNFRDASGGGAAWVFNIDTTDAIAGFGVVEDFHEMFDDPLNSKVFGASFQNINVNGDNPGPGVYWELIIYVPNTSFNPDGQTT